jgi:N4-gp56 family major capsid protein
MLNDIINPQVMGDMIEAKIPHMLKFTPFAKVDTTLVGVPGDTKTVPSWNFVGAAEDLAEDGEITAKKLTASTAEFTIKCAAQSVGLSQKSINSGLGDPVGAAEAQLAKAIAVKVDADVLAALLTAEQAYSAASPAKISYAGIVDAVDVLAEEEITDKVLFVNPAQVTALRKDADFMDKNKYGNEVMVSGEIGMIAGCRVVPSKQIVKDGSGNYVCPLVKLEPASVDTEYAETELPAVTIFLKAETQVDHEWFPKKQHHDITAAKYYGAALTNASKVVLATFKA